MTIQRDIREAKTNMDVAWREMLISVEKFTAAEAIFNDSTRAFRERYNIPDGCPMTVECLMDRAKDAIWQDSINDCRYYRERTAMFGTFHNAAYTRWKELIRELREDAL